MTDASTGRPIAGVTTALTANDNLFAATKGGCSTDVAGECSFDDVPLGTQRLLLRHSEYVEVVFGPFEVAAGSSQRVEPRLTRGVAVRGRVLVAGTASGLRLVINDAEGHLRRAEVRADHSFEVANVCPGRNYATLFASDRGTCMIDALAPGLYRVTAATEDGAERGIAEVVVGDGEVALTVECRAKD